MLKHYCVFSNIKAKIYITSKMKSTNHFFYFTRSNLLLKTNLVRKEISHEAGNGKENQHSRLK